MTERTILITAALVFGAALLAAPVTAQPARTICAAHDIVVARLAERFGERRQSIALASDGAAVETFASPETGTWTLTLTRPGGPTCLIAAGDAWQRTDDAPYSADPGA